MIVAELSVVGGKHAGQIIPLNRRKFLIGREQDCQLRPNSEMVSRHHCVFSLDDFAVRLRDLGSTNGTFVNGNRIAKETVLSSGDHIVIGNLEFKLVVTPGASIDPSASSSGFDLKTKPEDTQVTSQTVLEIPVARQDAAPAEPAAAEPVTTQAPAAPPAVQQAPVPGSDTAVMPSAQMMPGQYPYPPQMMQPMGYPGGMYGGYPYQHMMPNYGQMYPPMMPQGYAAAPEQQAAAPSGAQQMEVSLPDPSETGAKEEAAKGSGGSDRSDTAKPTGAADAILKQMSGRRPGA
ncbi:MAG: FHA domain-containing protein [Planctomycetaceae bacterium]|nr:FHA domain-containing protein [Planctomycetaceae bacterium]